MANYGIAGGCQICGSNMFGWMELPGAGPVALCHNHRHLWSVLLLRVYPEVYVEMNVSGARFRRMMSGWPSTSGVVDDEVVAREYLRIENEVLDIWEQFVADQRSEMEQSEDKKEEGEQ